MATRTYEDFYADVMGHYREQKFDQALDLLTREGADFPEEGPTIIYLRSCMAARTGQNDLALQLIEEARDKGIWYGEQIMRQSPSWEPLQGHPVFERLVEDFKMQEAVAREEPRLFTLEPEGGCPPAEGCPLVIALHGNNANGRSALNGWKPVTAEAWLLAALQSSQVAWSSAHRVWNDQGISLREVAEHFEAIRSRHSIDPERVLIAGFSMGGETALRIALLGTIPVRGFILLDPGGPTMEAPEEWLPLIREAKGRELRGCIFVGERDAEYDQMIATARVLNENGIPCDVEILPGLAHEYPPDFALGIRRALAFIEQ
jgi:pimeloyl-ACP methyl ester carboxylesterase